MSDTIEITVSRSFADIVKGVSAVVLSRRSSFLWWLPLGALLVWFQHPRTSLDLLVSLAFVTLLFIVSIPAMIFVSAWRSWRHLKQLDPFHFTFTPASLAMKSEMASVETKWEQWSSAFETKGLLIILNRSNAAHFLPKKQITPESQLRLKELLAVVLSGKVRFKPALEAQR